MASEWTDRHHRLLSCPLCGYEFSRKEKRSNHFADEHDTDDVLALAGTGSEGESRAD